MGASDGEEVEVLDVGNSDAEFPEFQLNGNGNFKIKSQKNPMDRLTDS